MEMLVNVLQQEHRMRVQTLGCSGLIEIKKSRSKTGHNSEKRSILNCLP